MNSFLNLQHTRWECKCQVIFIPKYRRIVIYKGLREHLGVVFRRLAIQKDSEIQ